MSKKFNEFFLSILRESRFQLAMGPPIASPPRPPVEGNWAVWRKATREGTSHADCHHGKPLQESVGPREPRAARCPLRLAGGRESPIHLIAHNSRGQNFYPAENRRARPRSELGKNDSRCHILATSWRLDSFDAPAQVR